MTEIVSLMGVKASELKLSERETMDQAEDMVNHVLECLPDDADLFQEEVLMINASKVYRLSSEIILEMIRKRSCSIKNVTSIN